MTKLEDKLKGKEKPNLEKKLGLTKDPYDFCYKALIAYLTGELLYLTTRFIAEYLI